MQTLTLEDVIANGAAWLDDNVPDWWELINTDILAIDDPDRCILGQVFVAKAHECGMYSGYLYWLSSHGGEDCGFYGFCDSYFEEVELREAWITFIENRRAELS